MKKFFYLAVAVLAVIATSCKPKEKVDAVQSMEIKPAETTLANGLSVRLSVLANPSTAKFSEAILWESSDTTVVTVDEDGVVYADEYNVGEAIITATYKDLKATCKVTVTDLMSTLTFTGAFLYDLDTVTYPTDRHEIESLDGGKFSCILANAKIWLMSEGFYVTADYDMEGPAEAALIEVEAPMYWDPDQSTVFSLGNWAVREHDPDSLYAHVGTPADIDAKAFCDAIAGFYTEYANKTGNYSEFFKAAGAACTGSLLNQMSYDSEAGGYVNSYIPDGFVTDAFFTLEGMTNRPMYDMSYCQVNILTLNDVDYAWGVELQDTIVNDLYEVTPVNYDIHWGQEYEFVFGEAPAKAPAAAPLHFEPISKANKQKLVAELAERNIPVVSFMKK